MHDRRTKKHRPPARPPGAGGSRRGRRACDPRHPRRSAAAARTRAKSDDPTASGTTSSTTKQRPYAPTYTVKLNDNLGSISEKTGVSVARLQELNPELDPQNLIVGQKIKLRE